MTLIKTALLGAAGYVAYKYYLATKEQAETAGATVRDAGPDAMTNPPQQGWSKVDQRIDESFPASDPPSTY
ncbi:hypothetical protein [Alteraurantiacibacter palmitatis]|uniref:Uncharacterized protein n=1 Tax=Alteraurantiacibacter palmitatis TaxID=2054628 RepID=A0ABV7E800_9SPHN